MLIMVTFQHLTVAQALQILQCTAGGLAALDVQRRLALYGYNTRPSHKPFRSAVYRTLTDHAVWVLASGILMMMAVQWLTVFHGIVWLFCSIEGTVLGKYPRECETAELITAVNDALPAHVNVLRSGKLSVVETKQLVPGDIIFLQTGDVVPADAKLLGDDEEKPSPLTVDEACLTGQGSQVERNAGDLLFMGSTVKQGEHRALVYATGMLTAYHMVRVPARQAYQNVAYGMAAVHTELPPLQAPHAVTVSCGKAAESADATA